MENAALLSFLQIFKNINNLGDTSIHSYDSDLDYALRINHAERCPVEGGGDIYTLLKRAFEKYDLIYVGTRKMPQGFTSYYAMYLL